MRWMHAIPIHRLHWHWCKSMKTIEVLYRRRMVWILGTVMPGGVIFKSVLVMMLVVHV